VLSKDHSESSVNTSRNPVHSMQSIENVKECEMKLNDKISDNSVNRNSKNGKDDVLRIRKTRSGRVIHSRDVLDL
jgi:hypothetical protein